MAIFSGAHDRLNDVSAGPGGGDIEFCIDQGCTRTRRTLVHGRASVARRGLGVPVLRKLQSVPFVYMQEK